MCKRIHRNTERYTETTSKILVEENFCPLSKSIPIALVLFHLIHIRINAPHFIANYSSIIRIHQISIRNCFKVIYAAEKEFVNCEKLCFQRALLNKKKKRIKNTIIPRHVRISLQVLAQPLHRHPYVRCHSSKLKQLVYLERGRNIFFLEKKRRC